MPSTEQQEIVLLSKILAADVNVGYEHNLTNTIVETVNGHPISTLRQLVDIVRQTRPDQDTVTFTTADKSIVVSTYRCLLVALSVISSPRSYLHRTLPQQQMKRYVRWVYK